MKEIREYLIKLNYSNRTTEKPFIKDILKNFNTNTLTGAYVVVNNNIYDFECYLNLHFENDYDKFEKWIRTYYPDKILLFSSNQTEVIAKFLERGYNLAGLVDEDTVDMIVSSEPNGIFLFPEKKVLKEMWKKADIPIVEEKDTIGNEFKVFLSHSSTDKKIVDEVYISLKNEGIYPWYDKYELFPGESITSKINEGLNSSDLGIIFLSKNFINSKSAWTTNEMNYFYQARMNNSDKINFICINIDLEHTEIPPLFQDYLYINYCNNDYKQRLIDSIKRIYYKSKNNH